MAPVTYLAKIGELMLKGKNRKFFERQLTENVRAMLSRAAAPAVSVRLIAGRLYLEYRPGAAMQGFFPENSFAPPGEAAVEVVLAHLIGITGWARAQVCGKDMAAIGGAAYRQALEARAAGASSFKIETRRADKAFPLTSYQVSAQAPERIVEEGVLRVDVHAPDTVIHIEIRDRVFVYRDAHRGCRGLPVGTAPKALLLLSGGIDSPVAGYRMMRRGMSVDYLYFHAAPYTSEEARQKVVDIASALAKFGIGAKLHVVSFTAVQTRIRERTAERFSTLLLRVCMMKAANLIARQAGAACLVTGESLGQVASQTLENLCVTQAAADIPVLRPLVGMDKEEIIETARFIGTYDTSILPYEDCCVLFAPEHPVLRAEVGEVRRLYARLDADSLIRVAAAGREVTDM
ncbi:MAG: tRNA 4-thiouridine(8) synthase ThiI [Spirochaetaceae bacterium]|nr:tRNA 4-thiouridine(8) synthase ThiI [Spirochaetaceae bacterium]